MGILVIAALYCAIGLIISLGKPDGIEWDWFYVMCVALWPISVLLVLAIFYRRSV